MKRKEQYEAPTTWVVKMKTEGMVCVSPQDYNWHDVEEE